MITYSNLHAGAVVSVEDVVAMFRNRTHFFDRDAMRFFRSRLMSRAFSDGNGGYYFATSEQFVPSRGDPAPRRYSVRHIAPDGTMDKACMDTIGDFQAYASARQALAVAKREALKGTPKH